MEVAISAHPAVAQVSIAPIPDPTLGERASCFVVLKNGATLEFEELKTFARLVLDDTQRFMTGVDEARLSEAITIPWAATDGAPLTITVAQALTQAAMHSHYHRGQNASRLRELGGVPPTTDLIVWYWNGRKKPEWEN